MMVSHDNGGGISLVSDSGSVSDSVFFGYAEVDAQLRDDLDRIGATLYRLIE